MRVEELLYRHDRRFTLESGSALPGFQLKYTTLGKLNADKSNVVWVCHALTGSSSVVEWWGPLFETGAVFDYHDHFIVSANVLGGCYGSTGPLSPNPDTGLPYFQSFPFLTNKDVIRAFDLLRIHLGIEKVEVLVGGSLGGQQVLEWAIFQPTVFKHVIPIACNAKQSSWGIAVNEAQRMTIEADSSWGEQHEQAGSKGLRAARAMSMITFRSYEAFMSQDDSATNKFDEFNASSYQQYQGEKLANRFNAFSYWTLTKMMDSHNVGRGHLSIENALQKISSSVLVIGIDSDVLFPLNEQIYLSDHIANARLEVLHSSFGHDAFLIEVKKLNQIIHQFLNKKTKVILNEVSLGD